MPARLGWKTDLAKLTRFNRKLMWVYGGTIVYIIVAFGVLTLVLHDEFLRGDRRRHSPWPRSSRSSGRCASSPISGISDTTTGQRGRAFVIGHVLLAALFVALASTFWTVLIWHWMKGTP